MTLFGGVTGAPVYRQERLPLARRVEGGGTGCVDQVNVDRL